MARIRRNKSNTATKLTRPAVSKRVCFYSIFLAASLLSASSLYTSNTTYASPELEQEDSAAPAFGGTISGFILLDEPADGENAPPEALPDEPEPEPPVGVQIFEPLPAEPQPDPDGESPVGVQNLEPLPDEPPPSEPVSSEPEPEPVPEPQPGPEPEPPVGVQIFGSSLFQVGNKSVG